MERRNHDSLMLGTCCGAAFQLAIAIPKTRG